MRDKILIPQLYEKRFPDQYECLEKGDPRAIHGRDTLMFGGQMSVDEKIVHWPKKPDGTPRIDPYTAYAFELMSNIVPGREKLGWMVTNIVTYLVYCFASLDENELQVHVLPFRRLQKWFLAQDHSRWHLHTTDEINKAQCRIVPFIDVPIPALRFHLKVAS